MDLPILYVKESQVEISIFKLFAFWVHVIVCSYSSLSSADLFHFVFHIYNSFRNTNRVSNCLNSDLDRHFIKLDLEFQS